MRLESFCNTYAASLAATTKGLHKYTANLPSWVAYKFSKTYLLGSFTPCANWTLHLGSVIGKSGDDKEYRDLVLTDSKLQWNTKARIEAFWYINTHLQEV